MNKRGKKRRDSGKRGGEGGRKTGLKKRQKRTKEVSQWE